MILSIAIDVSLRLFFSYKFFYYNSLFSYNTKHHADGQSALRGHAVEVVRTIFRNFVQIYMPVIAQSSGGSRYFSLFEPAN